MHRNSLPGTTNIDLPSRIQPTAAPRLGGPQVPHMQVQTLYACVSCRLAIKLMGGSIRGATAALLSRSQRRTMRAWRAVAGVCLPTACAVLSRPEGATVQHVINS